ncbi:DUF5709 domain-containing protein [Rhodococcus phenolicus]|uniref:DUF5709 domain-containing protein n=1 Tax=Rhodococcus phenolicus TaxID=263849 RepID=UPI00083278AD|nr:DUF5709 domain-containing protein [Rhodococcus phenolicus]
MPTSENPGASVPGEYSVDDEDQLQPEDTLIDRGVDDVLDEGISPPERPLALEPHDDLDSRLAEEEPDVGPGGADTSRAGRLVAPDEGTGEDTEPELLAEDVGIDGAGAGAEEAAVHVVDEDDIDRG